MSNEDEKLRDAVLKTMLNTLPKSLKDKAGKKSLEAKESLESDGTD
ncbi:MAG: hypothetical protein IPH06_02295 [Alphaproteobacteria bacterium]|nr:hypothetical protein [Alphaproteobacteria bacterium]QQS56880.1 MAG: hypothetical protein IPN28_11550 [Alphaproteobacteria bacterium]